MLADAPKISPEIVSEVDDLWAVMEEHSSNRDTGFRPDTEYVRAATRFCELKEQASQAMVWQYFKEPPTKATHTPNQDRYELQGLAIHKGTFRVELMRVLYHDPDLARWFLPLFRDRMQWVEDEIRQGRFLESVCSNELAALQVYLYAHAEMVDIEAFEHMLSMAVAAGIYTRRGGFEASLDEQMPSIPEAKAGLRLHAQPFWQRIALELAQYGMFDAKNLEKPHYIFPENDSNMRNQASPSNQGLRAKEGETQTVASQVILVGLTFLAVLLLVLAFRKRPGAV